MIQSADILMTRAWYEAPISEFLKTTPEAVIGCLVTNASFAVVPEQRDSWARQLDLLRSALAQLSGTLLLEYNIPRMGKRIDAVLLIGPLVFVVEFKVGPPDYSRSALDQVWDYALDLKNFHEASHNKPVVPVLVVTEAPEARAISVRQDADGVCCPILANSSNFHQVLSNALKSITGPPINPTDWIKALYKPTPTIVEAARALYAQHSVEAIARFDAGAKNLRITSGRIDHIIDRTKQENQKVICFVTGVPGAGKTLVGLNIATQHRRELEKPTHSVFLSGNGPLVAVLREALTRDEIVRKKRIGEKAFKGKVAASVRSFIQNVHHFMDEALATTEPPADHVVIFDEAQRAWTMEKTASFMRQKKKRPGFSQSEPEFLLSYMDRHQDWAVVVCLVGGGQEIHTGEAGIGAWLEAIKKRFSGWKMHISSELADSEYAAGGALEEIRGRPNTTFDNHLHLAVSMRSFRAEKVSSFVKALLDCKQTLAAETFAQISSQYPIVLTRDLGRAKDWIRSRARGSERYGIMASSRAQRLKPHAIDIRVPVDPVHWFLNTRDDTRSSYYLEDAATEFQVQGLELDWTCVTWDGDLRFSGSGWSYHDFRGSRWCDVHKKENRNYLRNSYRVLLTRARQGMVIFIPKGSPDDPTRSPDLYDPTYQYLADIGIPVVE